MMVAMRRSWSRTHRSRALSQTYVCSVMIWCATRHFTSHGASAYTMHPSFSALLNHADSYDAFILDQFGVLHNGVEALPGAIDCVEALHKAGKQLIVLSNTSAPAKAALAKLPKFGFTKECFRDAVTSGEEAAKHLAATYQDGQAALFLTWDTSLGPNNPRLTATPQQFLEKCQPTNGRGIQVAESLDSAQLVLCHGSEVWYRGDKQEDVPLTNFITEGSFVEAVDPLLQSCVQRKLPMVCANPDHVVVTPSGDGVAHMPGKIAQRYKDLLHESLLNEGQTNEKAQQQVSELCKIFGKPHVEHFQACLQRLGVSPDRVAHVGDSLHHDIAGANACGIDSILITNTGIHARDLGVVTPSSTLAELLIPDQDRLDALLEKEGIIPTHVVPAFRM